MSKSSDGKAGLLSIQEKMSAFRSVSEAKDQDILLVLGNTRVGKSTLVSYLSGAKFKAETTRGNPNPILSLVNESTGAKISHGSESLTKVPTKHIATKIEGRQLWDVPGFGDSAGTTDDVSNMLYLKQLMEVARSIKVILVASYNNIAPPPSVDPFCSFLNTIVKMFTNLSNIQQNFTIVFTRVPADLTIDDVCDCLDANIIEPDLPGKYSPKENQSKAKALVKHFKDNKNKISLFKQPGSKCSLVEDKILDPDGAICSTIIKSKSTEKSALGKVNLGLSSAATNDLKEIQTEMIRQYRTEAEKIVKSVFAEYTTKIQSSDLASLKDTHTKLKAGAESFKPRKHIETLQKLAEGIGKKIDTKQLTDLEESITRIQGMLPPNTSQVPQETPAEILEKELSDKFTMVSKSIRPREDAIHLADFTLAKSNKQAAIDSKQKEIDSKQIEINECKASSFLTGVQKVAAGTAGAVGGLIAAPFMAVAGAVGGVTGDFDLVTNDDDSVATKVAKAPVSAVAGAGTMLLASAPLAASEAYNSVKDTRKELRSKKADLDKELRDMQAFTPKQNPSTLEPIDFSIPKTDGASSSGTYNCILGMEYENEILNYPEVLKVLTDSLAINYSDVLDKVGGFDQEFVREACLSGNVELLEECFGN